MNSALGITALGRLHVGETHRCPLLVSSSKSERPEEGAEPLCRSAEEGTVAAESYWCWWIDENQLGPFQEHGDRSALAEHWRPSAALPTKGFLRVLHYLDVTHLLWCQQTALMWLPRPSCGRGLRQPGRDTRGRAQHVPPEQPPESLSLVEKEDFPERHLSLLSGYEGSPTLGVLREGAPGKKLQMQ